MSLHRSDDEQPATESAAGAVVHSHPDCVHWWSPLAQSMPFQHLGLPETQGLQEAAQEW